MSALASSVFQAAQSSRAVEHGSTLQKPVSVVAMFIVSTKVDTHQEQLMPFRQQRETVEGGVDPVAGGVRGMDAAAKPPRTG
ncbi:hypothetical protein AR275_14150 [Stenotrophomonas maltophilia]|nr:hypothetical protein AR275_14150 [Stenotrophomonas maltophilia]